MKRWVEISRIEACGPERSSVPSTQQRSVHSRTIGVSFVLALSANAPCACALYAHRSTSQSTADGFGLAVGLAGANPSAAIVSQSARKHVSSRSKRRLHFGDTWPCLSRAAAALHCTAGRLDSPLRYLSKMAASKTSADKPAHRSLFVEVALRVARCLLSVASY